MALQVTPVYRNLQTRVTFFGLEAEDLFAILALAVVANIFGRFLHREMFGFGTVTFDVQTLKIRVEHNWYETVSHPDEPREI